MSETLDALMLGMEDFPTIPDVVLEVTRELEREDCELPSITQKIAMDGVLASRIVQTARSPIFGGMMQDASVEQAIMRLGIPGTRDTVLAVGLMNTLPPLPAPLSLTSFWSLGLGSALSARQLARDFGYDRPEVAYLAALVHSLGEAYLALKHTERFITAFDGAHARRQSVEGALEDEFGVGHPAVAGRLLESWNFPEEVVDAVAHHLEPEKSTDNALLASLVYTADRICRDLRLAPEDPGHRDRAWVTELPAEIIARVEDLGYPDITFYLIEQREFLRHVEDIVRATFSIPT